MMIIPNDKYTKTYATLDNLLKAVEKLHLPEEIDYVVTTASDGKLTAVFFLRSNDTQFAGHIAHSGFKVIG